MIKLCGIEFSEKELKQIESDYFNKDKRFLIRYNTIYELRYINNYGLSGRQVYKKQKTNKYDVPIVKRGYFIITTPEHVNSLIEKELFI